MKKNIIIIFSILLFLNFSKIIYSNIIKYNSLNIDLKTKYNLSYNENDIIIILDTFFEKGNHGKIVSSFFNDYLNNINKNINIIYLNYEKSNLNEIEILNNKYEIVSNKVNIIKVLKEIKKQNPNKKIILSMSFMPFDEYSNLFKISNELDINIANAYFNNISTITDYINMFKFYFYFDKNGLIVYLNEKPYFFEKKITSSPIIENYKNHSTSILTPILAYNYYIH